MADLSYIQATGETKIVGQDATGNQINYVSADTSGNMLVKDFASGSASGGVAATVSSLIGGVFNTSLPTLTTGQQSAIQLDSSGRIIIAPLTSTSVITANQGAIWTVQPGNTANTTPWLVTVSTALPTGANTIGAVNQGTSPWIVQDNASNTSATTAVNRGLQVMGVFNTTPATLTNGQSGFLQLDSVENLLVNLKTALPNGSNLIGNVGQVTPFQIVGNTPAGSGDSGNGVKVSGVYNTAFPILTNGNRGDLQVDSSSRLIIRPLTIADIVTANLSGYAYSSYSPDPSNYATSNQTSLSVDAVGRLETHSTVTTDEGSFRDDFSGTTIANAISGTLGFTNGSVVVTGVGTTFTTSVVSGQWIKKSTDSETLYAQVSSISNDTTLFLTTPYAGTTASGVSGVLSNWLTITGAGATISVASSVVTVASGTTNGSTTTLQRLGDYLPYTLNVYTSISQRIANQTAYIGFVDNPTTVGKQATIQFTGTVNTQVNFVTASSSAAADIQTTSVTLPNGGTTNTFHTYKIDLSANQATLSIDGIVVAVQNLHIPGPYDNLEIAFQIKNTAAVTTTNLVIDYLYFSNWDRVQIDDDFQGEGISVTGPVFSGQTDSGGPIKIGGVFNTSQPTVTNGQRVDSQMTARGATIVATGVDAFTVTQQTITKGTQGATGVTTQDLKDAGRNQTNYFMAAQVVSTATDTLMSLTGYKSGAAVGATTTPAVVTAGKTYRIQSVTIAYIAITTAGTVHFTLRANTGGVVAIGSPAVQEWVVGGPAATAGIAQTVCIPIPDGMEFAAGTGIGVSMQGFGATGTAAAVGYGTIALNGFEY